MRLIDGDAAEKDLRESHDRLREIYNGLEYDDDRQICAGQLITFTEAILRIKDAPTIEPYGTWIPCSERLPNKPEFGWDGYLVQDAYIVKPYDAYWNGKCWTDIDDNVLDNIVAWMPLPEPYGEE